MGIGDELEKLKELRNSGDLTDEEYAAAKARLLRDDDDGAERRERAVADALHEDESSLGDAANRYVNFQIVMSIVGLVVFLIFLFAVFIPGMKSGPSFP